MPRRRRNPEIFLETRNLFCETLYASLHEVSDRRCFQYAGLDSGL